MLDKICAHQVLHDEGLSELAAEAEQKLAMLQ